MSKSKNSRKTGDLIGKKIANEITKKSPQNTSEVVENKTEILKERYLFSEEDRKLLMLII